MDKTSNKRVIVIGLDCAEPSLIFDRWLEKLPTLNFLCKNGCYGRLQSTIPCITVPAWITMVTGKDPGALGIYGFRNRMSHEYFGYSVIDARAIKEPRIWDMVGEKGLNSIVVGVPPSYPISPIRGWLVSCILTPSSEKNYTFPHSLRYEITDILNGEEYELDVNHFRTLRKDDLFTQIYNMTEKRLRVFDNLVKSKDWQFSMIVEIGTDRIHHAFWEYISQDHPLYNAHNLFEKKIFDYYKMIDEKIGELIEGLPNDTLISVVSDHGAKSMQGGVCINHWLIEHGYLTLNKQIKKGEIIQLSPEIIDWGNTIAWGEGGYCGRVWFNIKGREPNGSVDKFRYEPLRRKLADELCQIKYPKNKLLSNKCYFPEDIYSETRNIAPDILVYFGDLHYRSIGTLGHENIITQNNDFGPDGANHSEQGLYIFYKKGIKQFGSIEPVINILDIAPTILNFLDIDIPSGMIGKSYF